MQTNKTRSATPLDECRVYVGTYGKYNNGSIFGKWVELSDFDSHPLYWCKKSRSSNSITTYKQY